MAHKARCSSAIFEGLAHCLVSHSGNSHYLISALVTSDYRYLGALDTQLGCDELDAGLVGRAFYRRGGDFESQCIALPAYDLATRSPWRESDFQSGIGQFANPLEPVIRNGLIRFVGIDLYAVR
jgi:hypothetical protein